MKIAYLVNRYPAVSHSFIRREIAAVEAAGVQVVRFSIRACAADLPDAQDRREAGLTQVVLGQGAATLLLAVVRVALRHPGRWLRAAGLALAMAQGVPARLPRHLAYLVEACWLATRMAGVTQLHAHFGTNPAAVARLAGLLAGVPYSFTVHGPDEFDAPAALDLAGKIADARMVVAISAFGRSQLMRWSAFADWPRIAIVRCGVDASFADAPLDGDRAAPALCCVARLGAQKGIPLLIEAAAVLAGRGVDFRLKLVGDGEMRGEIARMIADRGLADRIEITGYLDAAGVRRALSGARAMVLPSFAEGLPVAIMEALALQTPVIVTAIAGTPELVDATCGWLIPAGSVERLAEAMAQALAADPARLRAMGEAGRARVLALHDSDRNGRQLAALFAGG